ncbi:MAG TPA: hypothetical protein VF491_06050 [Vicinamibacterales bacterium]
MPDVDLRDVLVRVQRRSRMRAVLQAITVGGAVFALSLTVTLAGFNASQATALLAGGAMGVLAALGSILSARSLTLVEAAEAVETSSGPLDNLIVTAAELDARPRPVRREIRDEIVRQAGERIAVVEPGRVVTLTQPVLVAVVVVIGCGVLSSWGVTVPVAGGSVGAATRQGLNETTSFTVRITPPPYTGRQAQSLASPAQISVIAGNRIQIDATGLPANLRDWIATESRGVEIRTSDQAAPKFLSVMVVPDGAPTVRVITPGKDSAFAKPAGQVSISIQGHDDLGVSSLSLRFTKAAGGGENLTFTEGEVPLSIARDSEQQWKGHATLVLDSMGLEDGDILVYRAIVRDTNPHSAPVLSDQYLIEIGKNAEIADAGFALPTEEKKYAISQQMVIYRTEQLLRANPKPPSGGAAGEKWLEQTRAIAIEQRMVRAEVVFLGGGEVEDELEEAARSDELAEGRLQNTGRAEMLQAINAMSRAEAQLNDGRAQEALVFERQALASLERALDRRRYFLRTVPDRSRIDVTRRLTGERKDARSWMRDSGTGAARSLEADRRMMRELAAASMNLAAVDASLAARLAAVDPASTDIQHAAVTLAAAASNDARRDAIRAAMQAVTSHALKVTSVAMPVGLGAEPLAGRLADELNPARPRR